MIFVTVGTHEQQFDRLVKEVDRLVVAGFFTEPVFVQTGYCAYEPQSCTWERFVPASEIRLRMEAADVVITHGGPSSFIEAKIAGKVPVVVPRRVDLGEHVNNHQVDFVRQVAERRGGIIPVYDIANLSAAISMARQTVIDGAEFGSHNADFCKALFEKMKEL